MFTLIQQKKKKSDLAKIESFLDLLKDYQDIDVSISRKKNATFIVADNEKYEAYGGALLYPQKVDSSDQEASDLYDETLCGAFKIFQPDIQEFWMARVCLCLKDQSCSIPENINCLRNAYKEMYRQLIAFGEQKNLDFLSFTLNSAAPFMNLLLGEEWPNRIDITYSGSEDRLCHGVLSITGKKFLTRKSRKSALSHSLANQNEAKAVHQGRVNG